MTTSRFVNVSVLVLVNLMWAAQYPAYKIAAQYMSPAALNFWSLLCAAAILAPFQRVARRWEPVSGPGLDRRAVVDFVLLGVFGILPPSILLSWGIARSTAANAAIIQLTIPVLMALLAVWILGERLTLLRVAGLAAALLGTVVTSKRELAGAGADAGLLAGNAVIFLAGLGSAFFNTYSKRLLPRFGGVPVLVYTYLVALVCCAATSMVTDRTPFYAVRGLPAELWLSIGALGAMTWGIAMVLWMWVLGRLEALQVSASVYMLPMFGVLLSAIFVGERITWPQAAGGLVVFAATFVTSGWEERRRAAADPSLQR
jgi:drug/metabolite transporter (DMT)-like permease